MEEMGGQVGIHLDHLLDYCKKTFKLTSHLEKGRCFHAISLLSMPFGISYII